MFDTTVLKILYCVCIYVRDFNLNLYYGIPVDSILLFLSDVVNAVAAARNYNEQL